MPCRVRSRLPVALIRAVSRRSDSLIFWSIVSISSTRSSARARRVRATTSTGSTVSSRVRACRVLRKKRAIVALGNSMLTIIWHLLSDPDAHYRDLGSDYFESRLNRQRRQRDLVRQLEHLTGNKVTLTPRAPASAAA